MKVWGYMMIMLTMMVFLYFIGFAPAGTADILRNDTGIYIEPSNGTLMSGDISGSGWAKGIFDPISGLIIIAGAGLAIVVGYFTRTFDWKLSLSGFFTVFVVKFLGFGWSIVQLAQDTHETWLVAVVATIFLPMTAMFVFSVVEWFGGNTD